MAREILIVDDERDIRTQIAGILEDEGFATRDAADAAGTYAAVRVRAPSLVILDVWLDGSTEDGLQILKTLRRDYPLLPVVMISGHATFDMAVNATRIGAFNFIQKPFEADALLHAITQALEDAQMRRENQLLRKISGADALVGESTAIREARKSIGRLAVVESRALITGPLGSGKTLAARLIHAGSARRAGPFVVFSCAGLSPEETARGLYGVEAGADDGGPRVGALEEAHGGTLVLKDIPDLPLATQAGLVRVLYAGRFRRRGGVSDVDVSVRALATSRCDPEAAIRDGRLREDLYYRLNVAPLEMPPLARRREDIPALIEMLARRAEALRGAPTPPLSDGAVAVLQKHDWPGNVWELQNVLERMFLLESVESGRPLDAEAAVAALRGGRGESAPQWARMTDLMNQPLRAARDGFEREYFLFHLARLSGNVSKVAAFAAMDRAALHRKLAGLEIRNPFRERPARDDDPDSVSETASDPLPDFAPKLVMEERS